MTALVIMVSGVYNVNIYGEVLSLTGGLAGLPDGAALTGIAFASIFGSFGKQLVAVALSLFAFSTLMAWAYYGELCFRYLFGDKITGWYRFFYLLAIPAGAVAGLSVIWGLSDICN